MNNYTARSIASVVVCIAGAASMYITKGETGIGWAVLGLLIIWGNYELAN